MDYYKVLGVSKDASTSEIREAYKKIANKCHPMNDYSPDDEEEFRKASEAYHVLKNEEVRAFYDKFIEKLETVECEELRKAAIEASGFFTNKEEETSESSHEPSEKANIQSRGDRIWKYLEYVIYGWLIFMIILVITNPT